ncbi:DUF6879 family protein [Kitasatospora sp. NPDC002965]|uniref:DUF6879 family protein n=1 Tax=Kitasatospora sp. NPDC002965 TaxID=3154775 RepID=UPI0033BF4CCC
MTQNLPDFSALLKGAQRTAVHLEMRDFYGLAGETDEIEEFKRSGKVDLDPDSEGWSEWVPLVRETVGRGVSLRRARVVSEPVTDYIRWEHALTPVNIAAGEQVRWLPRRLASDIALPGNDLWLIDERLVLFHWFAGDGEWAGHEYTEDPATVAMVSTAFETVWQRAVPHNRYTV